ncbi:uncharacterized protein H6S33_010902 [Morchella sextelata]|uniref:uncharacterized protein n=1 Tax=Morchella sextelata TaxID=1174677 RepID=UPI001D049DF1|nr:uncharacterized protein H6S33_010902 [Morchella sextelata]KAH0611637.1 hypothetical protein H6S33_010902 [Morchella sextelata]
MHLPSLLPLFTLATSALAFNRPLSTSGRWITDATHTPVTMVGTNWPGHLEPMIPEGLQYQSYKTIIARIKSLGMNTVRLTFAIQMVDEIYERNGTDVSLRETLVNALGQANGTRVLESVLKSNRDFWAEMPRLEVWRRVAAELGRQQVALHLDNHVSKAQWCCGAQDGNSWFGDVYFDVEKWKRGLAYLAAKAPEWPSLVSIGMRNELRQSTVSPVPLPYDFADWYKHMTAAASAIHAASPDVLIFFSGLNYSETLAPLPLGTPLSTTNASLIFRASDFPWADKAVMELHVYTMSDRINTTNCHEMKKALYANGFNALDTMNPEVVYPMPVVMSEFGFSMNDDVWKGVYAQCLKEFLPERRAGWMNWAVAGSYYVRSGGVDVDDTWGLLSHDWSAWRSESTVGEYLKPLARETLAGKGACT